MRTKQLMMMIAASAFCATSAMANTVYTLNGNFAGGPFGTVTLQQQGANAVSVDVALASGVGFVDTGIDNFDFSVLSTIVIAAGNISALTAGWSFAGAPGNTDGAPANPAGFTQYELDCTVCGNGGNNPNPGPLHFLVTATGLTEASFASLFVADICTQIGTGGTSCSGATGATWTTSSSTTSTSTTSSGPPAAGNAPEPGTSSLALMGVALLAGVFLKRRMSQRA